MRRTLMKSKIHRATVTGTDLHYVGSITIDAALMELADLVAHERVQVLSCETGARFDTYVIPGPAGSGQVALNGPAARLAHAGDRVIVLSYAEFEEAEVPDHAPTVVFVDEDNAVRRTAPGAPGAVA